MAIGGSSNTILHLMAIAHEAGVDLDLATFDRISRNTPRLCNLSPAGNHFVEDLYEAGGIQGVMKELAAKGPAAPRRDDAERPDGRRDRRGGAGRRTGT